jgi:hypothetical protein
MNRMQFGLTLFVAGFCLAFLASSLTSAPEPAWNPIEATSPLFTQQADPPARNDICPDVSSTVSKWQRPRISRAVREVPSATREPLGARVSLVAFATTSSTYQDCPGPDHDVRVFVSVVGGSGDGGNCSTRQTFNSECSVTGSGSAPPPWCSVNDGSLVTPCSAQNYGNPMTQECSAIDASGGQCSASSVNGVANFTCSTDSTAGGSSFSCSVVGTESSNSSCSTVGTNMTCSANGTAGGNSCSVVNSLPAGGNKCSANANDALSYCSITSNGDGSDFCSVTAGAATSQCTSFGGGNNCSVKAGATGGTCSGGTGLVNGICTGQ